MDVNPGQVVMCRACVVECTKYKSLHHYKFVFNRKPNTTYAELLEYITDKKFPENESTCLPEYICDNCIEQLIKAYVFRKMVLDADSLLRCELEDDGIEENNDSLDETNVENAKLLDEQYLYVHLSDSIGSAESPQLSDEDTKMDVLDQTTDSEDPQTVEIKTYKREEGGIRGNNLQEEAKEQNIKLLDKQNSYVNSSNSNGSGESQQFSDEDTKIDLEQETDQITYSKDPQTTDEECEENESEMESESNNYDEEDSTSSDYRRQLFKDRMLFEAEREIRLRNTQHDIENPLEFKSHSKKAKPYIAENKSHSQCKICGKHFAFKSSYKYHMQYHDEAKRKCEICGETLKTTNEYLGHISTHVPNKCDICGKSYKHPSSLRSHMKSHTGELQIINCRICSKSFTKKWNYQKHMLTHQKHMDNVDDDEIPYKCEYCDVGYTIEDNLNSHRRKHCNMFKCVECFDIFATKELLKDHMIWHPSSQLNISNKPLF